MTDITIDPTYLQPLLQRLVRIDSTNPSCTPAGAGETEIVQAVEVEMSDLGLEVTRFESIPGRPSLVGRWPGSGGGPTLMFNAHLDTVGVDGMAEPFSGEIRGGKLFGRGAQDMKGSMAAQLAAVRALQAAGVRLTGDLLIAGVSDEEFASIGVQEIIPHYPEVAAVVVTEPTDCQVSVAHKGFIWITVKTVGKAYHGSRPDLGIDANMRMGRFLGELDRLEQALRQRPPHPLLGPPSLHAAKIHGGSEISMYAAECVLEIERRTIPGETAATVEAEIQEIIDRLKAGDPTFNASLEVTMVRDPFSVDRNAPIVKTVLGATATVLGETPSVSGIKFWTDAAFHAAAGVDTVLIGPRGHGLHSAEEWVDLESVAQLAEILALTAVQFSGIAR